MEGSLRCVMRFPFTEGMTTKSRLLLCVVWRFCSVAAEICSIVISNSEFTYLMF